MIKIPERTLDADVFVSKATFNPCFAKINGFTGRYRILMGGAGSGKSCNIAQDFVCKMLDENFQGAHLLVIRKTYESHLNSTFPELCSAARRICGIEWRKYFETRKQPLMFRSKVTGATAFFRGIKDKNNREKLKSISSENGKICWIWCEEATELEAQDLELLDDRLRGEIDEPLFYQITLSFNPVSASHWLKRRFFDAMQDDNTMIHCSTYRDNYFIDANFVKRMKKREIYDPAGFKVYGLGLWGEQEGQIITHFRVDHTPKSFRQFDSMAFGTDFGFNHPHATILLGLRDDTVFVCDEWLARGKDTDEIAGELDRYFGSRWPDIYCKHLLMWCDSSEPDRIKNLRRLGWNARGVKKGSGSVIAQIDWLKAHSIVIDPSCRSMIEELQNWRWKMDANSGVFVDEPVNINDDAISALRYGIEGWRRESKISF